MKCGLLWIKNLTVIFYMSDVRWRCILVTSSSSSYYLCFFVSRFGSVWKIDWNVQIWNWSRI